MAAKCICIQLQFLQFMLNYLCSNNILITSRILYRIIPMLTIPASVKPDMIFFLSRFCWLQFVCLFKVHASPLAPFKCCTCFLWPGGFVQFVFIVSCLLGWVDHQGIRCKSYKQSEPNLIWFCTRHLRVWTKELKALKSLVSPSKILQSNQRVQAGQHFDLNLISIFYMI